MKPEIKALADKIIKRADALYPDVAVVFFSYWSQSGQDDNYSTAHGDQELIDRCLSNLEPKIRLMERRNLNPCQKSLEDIYNIGAELSKEGDPEISDLFMQISNLLLTKNTSLGSYQYFGEAILAIGWMELGITFHCYAEFSGMIRGVVSLFNAGMDSYRKLYSQEEG